MHTVVRPHDRGAARRARLLGQARQLVGVLGPELHRSAGVDVGHHPGSAHERDPGVHDVQCSPALERAGNRPAHRRAGQVHVRAHAGEDLHCFLHVGDVLHVRLAVTHARPVGMVHACRESVAAELEDDRRRVQARGVLPHDVEVVADRGTAEAAADRSCVGAQCDGRHEVVLRLPRERVAIEDDHGWLRVGRGERSRDGHGGDERKSACNESKQGRVCHAPTVRPSGDTPATTESQPSDSGCRSITSRPADRL